MKILGFEIRRAKKPGTQLAVVGPATQPKSRAEKKQGTTNMSLPKLFVASDNGNTEKELPRVVKGNRPNIELIVIPQMNISDPFEATGVVDALDKLKYSIMTRGCWNVCPINELMEILNIPRTAAVMAAVRKLSLVHCVDWHRIHPDAVAEMPDLINLILNPKNPADDIMAGRKINWDSL